MTINLSAGQVPTPDNLLALAPLYVAQGTDQSVASSITVTDSQIILPVDGLARVELVARYNASGGGIRWAWRATGTAMMRARAILSAGESTSSTNGPHNIADMRLRQIATLDEVQVTNHYSSSSVHSIWERCIVDGTGEIIFRFAQASSNANATILDDISFATIEPLRQG